MNKKKSIWSGVSVLMQSVQQPCQGGAVLLQTMPIKAADHRNQYPEQHL